MRGGRCVLFALLKIVESDRAGEGGIEIGTTVNCQHGITDVVAYKRGGRNTNELLKNAIKVADRVKTA